MVLFRFYFARVVAHLAALLVVPAVWWYWPKLLLSVIRWNTAFMGWLIRLGVGYIPEPTVRYSALKLLDLSDWLGRAIRAGLMLVPAQYRDQVEVLARVRYEPGGWLMVGELSLMLFVAWRYLTRHGRERALRKRYAPRPEEPPPL